MKNQFIAITIFLLSGSLSSTYFQPYIIFFELILFAFMIIFTVSNGSIKKQKKRDINLSRTVLVLSIVILISMLNSLFKLNQNLFSILNNHFNAIFAVLILSKLRCIMYRVSYKSILRHLEVITFIALICFTLIQVFSASQIILVKGVLSGKSHVYYISNIGSIFFVFFGIFRVIHFVSYFDFKSLLTALVFLSYPLVFQNSRILIIALITVAMFALIRSSNRVRQKAIFFSVIMVFILFFFYLIEGSNGFIKNKMSSINSATNLVLTGNSKDASVGTSIRLIEAGRAINTFKSNYMLGTGSIGSSWGTSGETYFYSSDLGILGIILEVGVLGFLLLMFVYKRIHLIFNKSSVELRYFFNILLVVNITTGFLYFEMLPTVMILALAIIQKQEDDSMDSGLLLK